MAETNPQTAETPAPAEQVQAAAQTPTPETQPVAEVSPRLQKLKDLGFEGVTEQDALDRVISAYELQKNQLAVSVQQALEEARATAQPTTAETDQGWWNPPKVDTALAAQFRQGDGWKPGTPPELIRQVAELEAYRNNFATRLLSDPTNALKPLFEEQFKQLFQQHFGEVTAQQQLTQFQQQAFTANPWLFEADPISGKPSKSLSAEGKLIDQYMREAQERGADYEFAFEFALNKHNAAKAARQATATTQAQTAQEINDQKKRDLLNRVSPAGRSPTGSLPQPQETRTSQRNQRLSPGQRAMQIAKRDGIAVN